MYFYKASTKNILEEENFQYPDICKVLELFPFIPIIH